MVGGNFVQITTRDITWQENLFRRIPVKYEIAIKPCNVNKTWIGKTAVKTSENTKQNFKLKFAEP